MDELYARNCVTKGRMSKLSLLLVFTLCCLFQGPALAKKNVYIVYLGSHEHGPQPYEDDFHAATVSHYELLGSFLGSTEEAREAIIYSYQRHINGFTALLEDKVATEIAKHPKVVSVFLNREKKLHTPRSWDFMMLEKEKNGVVHHGALWKKANYGEHIIIANIDTGVWPESKSFRDEGYGPVPSRWRGQCENDTASGFPCNKKLIGGRYYNKAYNNMVDTPINASLNTARDYDGHGTHTLSTAAGNFVPGAEICGVEVGTPKGGSPRARVAAYKACWDSGCAEGDIMAAVDAAIYDGVDVISGSLGGSAADYFEDAVALSAFHAVQKGIAVVFSAGNEGPYMGSVTNVAPWIITVGASTLDRQYNSYVELRDGRRFQGASITKALPENKFYPLVSGLQAKAAHAAANESELCMAGTLDPEKVEGKVVACLRGNNARVEKGQVVAKAGGVGMILCNDKEDGAEIVPDIHFLPASHINYTDGVAVMSYINTSSNPLGFITASKASYGVQPSPKMAKFSSVGPNTVTPDILKPDITASGQDIVAAYSPAASVSGYNDTRTTDYNILSGTSMSCPHVSGVVGLLKSVHPDWSPAAIRSAISTTARTRDNTMHPMEAVEIVDDEFVVAESTPFHHGHGHVRPNRAVDPGLIYDLSVDDYLHFLCATGYNKKQSKIDLFKKGYKCPESASLLDFNYPSITVSNLSVSAGPVVATRKLKNVGAPGTYAVRIKPIYGVSISVEPSSLTFDKIGEEKSFKVTLEAKWAKKPKPPADFPDYKFGGIRWSDGFHYVRSPIVVAPTP